MIKGNLEGDMSRLEKVLKAAEKQHIQFNADLDKYTALVSRSDKVHDEIVKSLAKIPENPKELTLLRKKANQLLASLKAGLKALTKGAKKVQASSEGCEEVKRKVNESAKKEGIRQKTVVAR